AAVGAGALQVGLEEETLAGGAVRQLLVLHQQLAALVKITEETVDELPLMVVRTADQVRLDGVGVERAGDRGGEVRGDLLGAPSQPPGRGGDVGLPGIEVGEEDDLLALEAKEAGQRIRTEVGTREVPDVEVSIGGRRIGDDDEAVGHARTSRASASRWNAKPARPSTREPDGTQPGISVQRPAVAASPRAPARRQAKPGSRGAEIIARILAAVSPRARLVRRSEWRSGTPTQWSSS